MRQHTGSRYGALPISYYCTTYTGKHIHNDVVSFQALTPHEQKRILKRTEERVETVKSEVPSLWKTLSARVIAKKKYLFRIESVVDLCMRYRHMIVAEAQHVVPSKKAKYIAQRLHEHPKQCDALVHGQAWVMLAILWYYGSVQTHGSKLPLYVGYLYSYPSSSTIAFVAERAPSNYVEYMRDIVPS